MQDCLHSRGSQQHPQRTTRKQNDQTRQRNLQRLQQTEKNTKPPNKITRRPSQKWQPNKTDQIRTTRSHRITLRHPKKHRLQNPTRQKHRQRKHVRSLVGQQSQMVITLRCHNCDTTLTSNNIHVVGCHCDPDSPKWVSLGVNERIYGYSQSQYTIIETKES